MRDALPPGTIIPFAALDPRRRDLQQVRDNAFDKLGFKGVKLYPPLGYAPTHPKLMELVYPYCLERGLPITAHCSRGGVCEKNKPCSALNADPDRWVPVLDKFPELKLCLAHFGGIEDWRGYLDEPWPQNPPPTASDNWLSNILDMIRSKKYPNLYTDIAYTAFYFPEVHDFLSVLLTEPVVRDKVLFGSDFYMAEQEKIGERQLAITLRAALSEGLFWQIANTNPQKFL